MGSFSIMHWGIVLVIVMLLFGTKKLSSAGSDLGKAIRGFKDGVNGVSEPGPVAAQADAKVATAVALDKPAAQQSAQ
jgi:sec-independent protein translocase protein TatA